ncbi:olfactory receptor 6N1-like [Erpetoichthys calabaricus]|uniref:olfactory receptor 6N1-like n=1 Tax=Erpetoichthys calabaricus TaxID=27687 RepID=UPI002233F5E8|nr:olfactory receptor 6N1-like [Erpetoichthys calabaricus]
MQVSNGTSQQITEFILVGVPGLQDSQNLLCIVFLLAYFIVMTGNLLILSLVILDQRLHTPMYFFLCHLAVLDIMLSTIILPKMFAVFLLDDKSISVAGCFTQMYLVLAIGGTENVILIVMAYDRYVAIMKPLHYHVIINGKLCVLLAIVAWILGHMVPVPALIQAIPLIFCGPNKIDYCYCDYPTVVSLACDDVTAVIENAFVAAMCITNIPFLLIICSYVRIIKTIAGMKKDDRKKALSTCVSHLLIVLIYYFSADLLYITALTHSSTQDTRVIIGVFAYILAPILNPIIYSLRNKQIKQAAEKYLTFLFRPQNAEPLVTNGEVSKIA